MTKTSDSKHGIVLVGMGKIARDQHIPKIAASKQFELVAVVTSSAEDFGVPSFQTLKEAISATPNAKAVSLCTPPAVRFEIASTAFANNCALMLEKPPAASVQEALAIEQLARVSNATLFASWHSRSAPLVTAAIDWASRRQISKVEIVWHEDVLKWHPNQEWLWQEDGFGVLDTGINALSILTAVLPVSFEVERADYEVPSNAAAPIAAVIELRSNQTRVSMSLDFRHRAEERWEMVFHADSGEILKLFDGGASLQENEKMPETAPSDEYANLYAQFSSLINRKTSDFDISPLRIVEHANLLAHRTTIDPVPT